MYDVDGAYEAYKESCKERDEFYAEGCPKNITNPILRSLIECYFPTVYFSAGDYSKCYLKPEAPVYRYRYSIKVNGLYGCGGYKSHEFAVLWAELEKSIKDHLSEIIKNEIPGHPELSGNVDFSKPDKWGKAGEILWIPDKEVSDLFPKGAEMEEFKKARTYQLAYLHPMEITGWMTKEDIASLLNYVDSFLKEKGVEASVYIAHETESYFMTESEFDAYLKKAAPLVTQYLEEHYKTLESPAYRRQFAERVHAFPYEEYFRNHGCLEFFSEGSFGCHDMDRWAFHDAVKNFQNGEVIKAVEKEHNDFAAREIGELVNMFGYEKPFFITGLVKDARSEEEVKGCWTGMLLHDKEYGIRFFVDNESIPVFEEQACAIIVAKDPDLYMKQHSDESGVEI